MGKLDGKVAVITGAASGIGRGVANLFAKEGAAIGIFDLDKANADKVAHEVAAHGGKVAVAIGDVGRETDVAAGLKKLVARSLGDVDILVNNAGIDTTHELDGMPTEMWDRMLDVHLRGTFLFTRRAAGDEAEEVGTYHQPVVAARPQGCRDHGSLCCRQGRHHGLHPGRSPTRSRATGSP